MFVVAWHKQQNWLKVESVDEHIRANLNAFAENADFGMVLLGLFDTQDQASEFATRLRAMRPFED